MDNKYYYQKLGYSIKIDKSFISIYKDGIHRYSILAGQNSYRVGIYRFDIHGHSEYPIITGGLNTECIMDDFLTIYTYVGREKELVVELVFFNDQEEDVEKSFIRQCYLYNYREIPIWIEGDC